MNMELSNHIGNEKMPSIVKDPFKKNCVTRISIDYSENIFKKEDWEATGWVDFVNGNSKGQQKFKGKTFDEVALQIKAFLKTLE